MLMNKNLIGKLLGATLLVTSAYGTHTALAKDLDQQAANALHAALDDEYKAWSLYQKIIKKHGEVRPFSNIIHAEKKHADALIDLLKKYGQRVPANPYENEKKASIKAPETVLEACKTGVEAEIDNVALYDNKLLPAVREYADITSTMKHLRDASQERHLRAFQRCISRGGRMGGGRHGNMMGGKGRHGENYECKHKKDGYKHGGEYGQGKGYGHGYGKDHDRGSY